MTQAVQSACSVDNIHRGKHETIEDCHDARPEGRSTRDRINQNQEKNITG